MKTIGFRTLLATVPTVISVSAPLAEDQAHKTPYMTPSGVMGDHMLTKGTMMVSYRYTRMVMEGNRDGGTSLPTEDVLIHFPVAPTSMSKGVHLMGAIYAPSDSLTIMGMIPYIRIQMDHLSRGGANGGRFTTRSEGIGDVSLLGMIRLIDGNGHHAHLGAGVSFPTGSLSKRDDIPAMNDAKLPYPMQVGSGTVDLKPSINYRLHTGRWSWGGQMVGTIRLGDNNNGYTLGDRFMATGWGAVSLQDSLSLSARLRYQSWGNVRGADAELNPAMSQTARPDFQGGRRLDLLFGANLMARIAGSNGHLFGIEGGFPLVQSLDGPQLESDWTLIARWHFMF